MQYIPSVQSLSHVRLFATPWIAACQASLSITNSRSLFKLMPIESVMPSSHLILCRPLLLLPPIPPSIRVFSNESTLCMRWPKYWSFSLSISPSIYTLNAHKVICQLYLKNERNHPSTSSISLIPEIFPSLNPACYSSIFQEISLALPFPPDACNFIVLLDKLLQRVIYTHCLKLTFL